MRLARLLLAFTLIGVCVYALPGAIDFEHARAGDKPRELRASKASYGVGMIAYGGKGAEAWRYEYVKEKRRAADLQRRLTRRVLELRRLRRHADARSGFFFGWLADADCIYRHERGSGGWETNTGNGYFGGMQADRSFQSAYGSQYVRLWGTANRWPWWAQLHMAWNGWVARGWQPWPSTSITCGLR